MCQTCRHRGIGYPADSHEMPCRTHAQAKAARIPYHRHAGVFQLFPCSNGALHILHSRTCRAGTSVAMHIFGWWCSNCVSLVSPRLSACSSNEQGIVGSALPALEIGPLLRAEGEGTDWATKPKAAQGCASAVPRCAWMPAGEARQCMGRPCDANDRWWTTSRHSGHFVRCGTVQIGWTMHGRTSLGRWGRYHARVRLLRILWGVHAITGPTLDTRAGATKHCRASCTHRTDHH